MGVAGYNWKRYARTLYATMDQVRIRQIPVSSQGTKHQQLGRLLAAHRRSLFLSQAEVGERAGGLSQQVVSDLEGGLGLDWFKVVDVAGAIGIEDLNQLRV